MGRSFLQVFARIDGHEVGQTRIPERGFMPVACSCGESLRNVSTPEAGKMVAEEHFKQRQQTAAGAAKEWLEGSSYHRDAWRLLRAEQKQVQAIMDAYGPDDDVPEPKLEELTRRVGRAEGLELATEAFIRGWLADRRYMTFDLVAFSEAVDAEWDRFA